MPGCTFATKMSDVYALMPTCNHFRAITGVCGRRQVYAWLHVHQRERDIRGHTAEVGVYHGRSFVPLALLTGPNVRRCLSSRAIVPNASLTLCNVAKFVTATESACIVCMHCTSHSSDPSDTSTTV